MRGAEPADTGLGGSSLGSAPSQADRPPLPRPWPSRESWPLHPGRKAKWAAAETASASGSTGKLQCRTCPWKCTWPAGLGWASGPPHFPEVSGAANWQYPTTQAFSQAACSCGLSHRTGATAPSPHLQPSSSSSWPLPHVWFPLATRQTLGVALPSGGRPPLGPSSLLPPFPGRLPGSGPSDGGAPSTQRPLLRQGETEAAPCQG